MYQMHSIYVKKRSDWRISSTSGIFHLTKSEVQNRHVACSKVFGSLFVRRKLRSTEMEANLSQAAPLYHPSSLGRFLVFLFYVSPAFYETIHVFHCTQKYNASIRYMYYELNKKKLHCLSLYNCDSWDHLILFLILPNYPGYMFFANRSNNVLIFSYLKALRLANRSRCYNRKKKKT